MGGGGRFARLASLVRMQPARAVAVAGRWRWQGRTSTRLLCVLRWRRIEAIRVTHSIPDCCGLIMRSDEGTIVHTGEPPPSTCLHVLACDCCRAAAESAASRQRSRTTITCCAQATGRLTRRRWTGSSLTARPSTCSVSRADLGRGALALAVTSRTALLGSCSRVPAVWAAPSAVRGPAGKEAARPEHGHARRTRRPARKAEAALLPTLRACRACRCAPQARRRWLSS